MQEELPKIKTLELISVLKRLIRDMVRASTQEISILIVMMILLSLLPISENYLIGKIIDETTQFLGAGVTSSIPAAIIQLILLLLAANIAGSLLGGIRSYFDRRQYHKLHRYFIIQFLNKISSLDTYHFENSSINDTIQKARESYYWRPQNSANRLLWMGQNVVEVIATLVAICSLSVPMAILLILTIIPSVILNTKVADSAWDIWGAKAEVRRKYEGLSTDLSQEESLMSIRMLGARQHLLNMTTKLLTGFLSEQEKAIRYKNAVESLTTIFSRVGKLIFLTFAVTEVLQGRISIGLLAFYFISGERFTDSIDGLFRNIAWQYEDLRYLTSYYQMLDIENVIKSGDKVLPSDGQVPAIEFKHVDFTYPDATTPVLTNFELTINPGERVAFVGENGAGKTTIVKLLCRFYDVTSGEILIDGQRLQDLELDSWYRKIGVLFQNFPKYNYLSVAETIGLGNIESIQDTGLIGVAANKAGAAEIITKLRHGYQQVLTKAFPEGTDLSGGQWQRIALARAFFRDAPILILDEPTSAIDAKGEYEIFERLYEFSQGKTVIIISHRFSTVRRADKIYVVEEGKIVEGGSHEELMSLNGKYADAFSKQAEGYK